MITVHKGASKEKHMGTHGKGQNRPDKAPIDALHVQRSGLKQQPVICAWCQKVRDDGGEWHRREGDQSDLVHADYSHGICPVCQSKFFGGRGSRLGA